MDSHRTRILRLVAALALALGATGCGPLIYASRAGAASRAVERARHAGAAESAPYEFYTAEAYLHKAREDAGEAAYQDAIAYARIARESADEASERAAEAGQGQGR